MLVKVIITIFLHLENQLSAQVGARYEQPTINDLLSLCWDLPKGLKHKFTHNQQYPTSTISIRPNYNPINPKLHFPNRPRILSNY